MAKVKIAKLNNLLDIVNTVLVVGIIITAIILLLSLF